MEAQPFFGRAPDEFYALGLAEDETKPEIAFIIVKDKESLGDDAMPY